MGKLLVIDGLDGSGKAMQRGLLEQRLQKEGHAFRGLTFPNYESDSSALVRMYLAGDFGEKPSDVNAYAASAFYAVDRYAGYKQDWGAFYEAGGLLLADRYTTSNLIHQCAKLPKAQWAYFVNWLEDFEYGKLGIPKPELVFFLDVEPEVSQKLMAKRYENQDKRDIHERDLDYLARCRRVGHWGAETLGWVLVPCTRGGEMRPPEEIADELFAMVKERV